MRAPSIASFAFLSICLFASTSRADATLQLVWVATSGSGSVGTSSIEAAPGDELTLELRLFPGTEGISLWSISLRFEADLQDELDIDTSKGSQTPAGANEFGIKPTITCTPFPACFFDTPTLNPFDSGVAGITESTSASTGFVFSFEAATLGTGVTNTYGAGFVKIGEIFFTATNNIADDVDDIASGLFNLGFDGALDNAGQPVAVSFGGAGLTGAENTLNDADLDGILDESDNCSLVPNADQRDTNADGFGNVCDADYNDDGIVGLPDFARLRAALGLDDPDVDFNGDGVVGLPDFNFYRSQFGGEPGPSGYACAGTIPCP